jgi:uncharacterized coiled-coil protein SlyX
MNDQNREPVPPLDQMESALTGIGYQIRKGLDRVGFEADKRMRINRVRLESGRLQKQAGQLMDAISERVLELEAQGAEMEPTIKALVGQVRALRKQLAEKAAEIGAMSSEQWVEPPPPLAPPQGSAQKSLPSGQPRVIEGTKREVSGRSVKGKQRTTSDVVLCPNCNGPLRPMSVFCPNCGYKL